MPIATTDLLAAIPHAALGSVAFLKGIFGMAAWLRLPKSLAAYAAYVAAALWGGASPR